jgi:glycosyltransferase involved in cell wall biosynthesis
MNILELLGKSDNHGERSDILNISGANILPPSDKQSNDNDVISSVDKSLEDNINEVLNISVNPDIKVSENIPETLKNTENRTRVMFCGTYPIGQSNGYSRVVYNTAKHLGLYDDIKLTIYGFQNFKQVKSTSRNDIPNSVVLHDAFENENPKRKGFGENEIADFIKKNPQDIVIIFNDSVITSALIKNISENLSKEERSKFKLVSYMDQVYPYQRKEYIDILNAHIDAIITFTPYWKKIARDIGIKEEIPIYFYPHGFDTKLYFPIKKNIARTFYSLPQDSFIILNLNRNQPRKRWDHTIMAYADIVQRHIELKNKNPGDKIKPIQLMIGTQIKGFWDLLELFEIEVKKRGIDVVEARKYITSIARPQQMSDRDINILYNSCDIGLNTCEGEGFGLCQFEHLAVGCPQVAPDIGGFKEFLNDSNSILTKPKWFYYVDKIRDGIGGYAEVSDPKDIADAIWKYYTNPNLVKQHGVNGRKNIVQNYSWKDMVGVLHKIIHVLKE